MNFKNYVQSLLNVVFENKKQENLFYENKALNLHLTY